MNPIQAVINGKRREMLEAVEQMLHDPNEVVFFEGELTREVIYAILGASLLVVLPVLATVAVPTLPANLAFIISHIFVVVFEATMGIQIWYRHQAGKLYRRRRDDKPYKRNGLAM
ncbi:MAG: hypothetical protein AAF702_33580 [Chloroflexota bacterium]